MLLGSVEVMCKLTPEGQGECVPERNAADARARGEEELLRSEKQSSLPRCHSKGAEQGK